MNRHHIIRLWAMAPYAKGMTEFMNSCGLQHRSSQLWRHQHLHTRLESPLAQTLNLNDLKTTPTIAGSPLRADTPAWWAALQDLDMGLVWGLHPSDRQHLLPNRKGRFKGQGPTPFPSIRRLMIRGLKPHTPVLKHWWSEGRCGQDRAIPRGRADS